MMKNKYKRKMLYDAERIQIYIENTFSIGVLYEYGLVSVYLLFLKIDILLRK